MANERRLISVCGECANYDWKKHKCTVCSCKESDPKNPFYDDCPLPKAVEVIYCKDCKWFAPNNNGEWFGCQMFNAIRIVPADAPSADDFYSRGERRCE